MAKCEYAIRNKSGLTVIYGEVGTENTTIQNKLRERFGDDKFTVASLNSPKHISNTVLLKVLTAEFCLVDMLLYDACARSQ